MSEGRMTDRVAFAVEDYDLNVNGLAGDDLGRGFACGARHRIAKRDVLSFRVAARRS